MKDNILQIVQTKGPLLPATISKECGIDSIMAAAYLAELVSNKKIMLSYLKVGGSPLYYYKGQEARLQDYKNNLNEKDQSGFDLLKKEKIVRDSELSPLMRVVMRTIRDFAIPLKVNKKEIFWKWYLISNDEALQLIKGKLSEQKEPKKEEVRQQDEQVKLKDIELQQKTAKKQKKEIEKPDDLVKRENEVKKKETELKEKLEQQKQKLEELKRKEKELEEREKKLLEKFKKEKEQLEEELKQKEENFRKRILEEQGEEEQPVEEEKDEFLEHVKVFCEKNNVMIEETEIIKKNKEVDMIVSIPTPVGNIRYFCRAKDKKKCNDGDLSSAYLKGQSKVLPALFLTTGGLTKHAEEMVGNEFKQMVVRKIENGSPDN
jgi:hypothetical protein